MKNIVDNLAVVGIGLIMLLAVGGYYYLSASTYDQKAFVAVAADQKYLENNQQA
jgi:hypothetical protein